MKYWRRISIFALEDNSQNKDTVHTNNGKSPEIDVGEKKYIRNAIKIHYIEAGEDNYIDIVFKYALPLYKPGDIISISEKIISLCQNRVVYKKDVKVSSLAMFLSKFVHTTPAGDHIGIPHKMQVAINLVGPTRIVTAALISAITRPFGIKGLFYKIAGKDTATIDGFESDFFQDYLNMAFLPPAEPDNVCNEIYQKLSLKISFETTPQVKKGNQLH